MQLLNRTSAAFNFTCERLVERTPQPYFWTFTFKKVPIDDSTAMGDWHTLHARLGWHFKWMQGVRVAELHRSHGIHFHAILNSRIPIRRIREIIYGSGRVNGPNRYLDFGRMSVTKCDAGSIGYMAKYLTKDYRRENNFWGRRRWGTIGGFAGTKCADVEYDTPMQRSKTALFGKSKVDYATVMLIGHYSQMWGDAPNWPMEYQMRVVNFATRDRSNGDVKTHSRKPLYERIDTEAMLWRGHVEMCATCRWGSQLCKRGLELFHSSIYCEWKFPAEKPSNVTECNKSGEADLSEVEERDSEKKFLPKKVSLFNHLGRNSTGGVDYVIRPFNELATCTEFVDCPF